MLWIKPLCLCVGVPACVGWGEGTEVLCALHALCLRSCLPWPTLGRYPKMFCSRCVVHHPSLWCVCVCVMVGGGLEVFPWTIYQTLPLRVYCQLACWHCTIYLFDLSSSNRASETYTCPTYLVTILWLIWFSMKEGRRRGETLKRAREEPSSWSPILKLL